MLRLAAQEGAEGQGLSRAIRKGFLTTRVAKPGQRGNLHPRRPRSNASEAPEVSSSLCPSAMRMGWWERGRNVPISNPREQQRSPHHPPSGQEMGRAGDGWVGQVDGQSHPNPSGGTFPVQQARSPEREKEKAEGLSK